MAGAQSGKSARAGRTAAGADDRRFPLVLLAVFVAVWAWLALDPVDRFDWFLENLLVFVGVPLLVLHWRRCPLSRLAYACLFVFLLLHSVGAHYTYSLVPIGFDAAERFDLTRNHYDRLVHFGFGLLVSIPVLEVQARLAVLKSWWSYLLPVTLTFSLSGLFEIIEWVIALLVDPAAGAAYLGTQGDEWDAQKDMALALVGALIAMTYAWLADRRGRPMHRNRCAVAGSG
jgi:putative membrane protein